MEFRLVYDGPLPAASQSNKRRGEKHRIRREFAEQLTVLWDTHPRLLHDRHTWGQYVEGAKLVYLEMRDGSLHFTHPPPEVFERSNRRFIPLITNAKGVGCALDILFLRRDQPGNLVRRGGDIDNRLKVLFDALKLPDQNVGVPGNSMDDPDPFHCLLEDDSLITDVKVTTDRLLTPAANQHWENDVRLIIHVRTVVLDPSNLGAVAF